METHPPWLRFHLGISRWELYNRKDPNLAQLTHYLATQRILGAGEHIREVGRVNRPKRLEGKDRAWEMCQAQKDQRKGGRYNFLNEPPFYLATPTNYILK